MIRIASFDLVGKLLFAFAATVFLVCCDNRKKQSGRNTSAKEPTLPYLKKQSVYSYGTDSTRPGLFLENYSVYPSDYRADTVREVLTADKSSFGVHIPLGRLCVIRQPGVKNMWIIPGSSINIVSRIPTSFLFDTMTIKNGEVFIEQLDPRASLHVDANGMNVVLKGGSSIAIQTYDKVDSIILTCTKGSGTATTDESKTPFRAGNRLFWYKKTKEGRKNNIEVEDLSDWAAGLIKEERLSDFLGIIGKLFNKQVVYDGVDPADVNGAFRFYYTHSTLEQTFKMMKDGFHLDCSLVGDTIMVRSR